MTSTLEYRFTGRIAKYFRSTDNAWAKIGQIATSLDETPSRINHDLQRQMGRDYVERRGFRKSYEYRFIPELLHQQVRRQKGDAHA